MGGLYFLQQCINAVQVSCFYALLAVAYVLVHGIADRINLAFGAIAMWGAYLTIGGISVVSSGFSFPLSAVGFGILFALVGTAALGYVFARVIVVPLAASRSLAMLIATVGAAIVIEEVMRLAIHSRELLVRPILADTLVSFPFPGFAIRISVIQALVVLASLMLAGGLAIFVRLNRFGRAWRACSQDLRMVALLGINPRPILVGTMVAGSCFAAASGMMIAIYYGSVSFYMGAILGLKALYVAVLGGLNSIGGAIAGAFILGFFESMWSGYFAIAYRDVASFLALTFLLIMRPGGLFAAGYAEKV